jgi:hypothetical protein
VYSHLIYSTAVPIPAFLISVLYIILAYNFIYAEVGRPLLLKFFKGPTNVMDFAETRTSR